MATTLGRIVQEVKLAIIEAELAKLKLKVSEATLTIVASDASEAGGEHKIGPIEIGATLKKSEVQTLTLNLEGAAPTRSAADTMATKDLRKDLVESIRDIGTAVVVAAAGDAPLSLKTATVELNFGVDKSGKLKIGIGGSKTESDTHGLKLTLSPAP